jgi:hypothetical protein
MSSDETTRIEPTLIATDAPSIVSEAPAAAEAKAESETAKNESTSESAAAPAKAEAPAIEAPAIEAPAVETPVIEAPKAEEPALEAVKLAILSPETPAAEAAKPEAVSAAPGDAAKSETPVLPPEPQIDPVVVTFRKPEPAATPVAPAATSRSTRFALLAASIAIAASFGAIGGSLGAAKFGLLASAVPEPAAPVAPIAKERVAEEVRALKESVAQLRATTRALSDGFATLKATVTTASTQNGKIAETLERIEKAQIEQRKIALSAPPATSAPATVPAYMISTVPGAQPLPTPQDVTGSIAQRPGAPVVLGSPPTTLKPPAVPGFVLRRVYDGAALIEGRDGMIEVEPGIVAPGLGRIEAIRREDGRWVVVTARGIVR